MRSAATWNWHLPASTSHAIAWNASEAVSRQSEGRALLIQWNTRL
jgi:hypothetical protein